MDSNNLKQLEILVHSQGWLILEEMMQDKITSLTESICNPNTDWDTTVKLRAERVAMKELIEQPVLTLQEFETNIMED